MPSTLPIAKTTSQPTPVQDAAKDNFISRLATKASDQTAHADTVETYIKHFDYKSEGAKSDNSKDIASRKENAQGITNAFYDMVTDFYEYGWGQ
ncbi:MAG: hypothetical protein SGCHY_004571, partial [Lobulomycetales sp.]